MNVPLIASIAACVIVILFASIFILYRRKRNERNRRKTPSNEDEKTGFCGGKDRRRLTSPRKDRINMQGKIVLPEHGGVQLMDPKDSPSDGGYLSGGEMFLPNQQPTFIPAFPATAYMTGVGQQQYINWPLPGFPNQPHMTAYPYKQSFEQITPASGMSGITPVYYAKSNGEG